MQAASSDTDWIFNIEEELWKDRAACKGSLHLFYGAYNEEESRKEPGRHERIRKAKELCRSCPVQQDCLNYALKRKIKHGIFGGKTGVERLAILRKKRLARLAAEEELANWRPDQ